MEWKSATDLCKLGQILISYALRFVFRKDYHVPFKTHSMVTLYIKSVTADNHSEALLNAEYWVIKSWD